MVSPNLPLGICNCNKKENSMIDIKKAEQEAKEELAKERTEEVKRKLKTKMKEIETAKLVVRNLEREYEDLVTELVG